MNRRLKRLILKMEKEYLDMDGYVTCEIAITFEATKDKKLLKLLNRSNGRLQGLGEWKYYFCNTCRGYNKNTPYHLEIVGI